MPTTVNFQKRAFDGVRLENVAVFVNVGEFIYIGVGCRDRKTGLLEFAEAPAKSNMLL